MIHASKCQMIRDELFCFLSTDAKNIHWFPEAGGLAAGMECAGTCHSTFHQHYSVHLASWTQSRSHSGPERRLLEWNHFKKLIHGNLDLDLFAFPNKFQNFLKIFASESCFRGTWKSSLRSLVYASVALGRSTFKKPTVLIRALSFLRNLISLCRVVLVGGMGIAATRLTWGLNEWILVICHAERFEWVGEGVSVTVSTC